MAIDIGLVRSVLAVPSLFIAAMMFGLLLACRWRRAGRLFLVVGLVGLYAASIPFTAGLLMRGLEFYEPLDLDSIPSGAQAIIVLASDRWTRAPEYRADTVGALTLERLRYAAALHRRTGLPILASGGGRSPGSPGLADLMKSSLERDFGVPVQWIEPDSSNTAENAAYSARIVRANDLTAVFLVTHAWHMPRSIMAFDHACTNTVAAPMGYRGYNYHVSPFTPSDYVPAAWALGQTAAALHEWIGMLWYHIAFNYMAQSDACPDE